MRVCLFGQGWEGGREGGRKDRKEDRFAEGRRGAMRLYIQLVFLVLQDKCTISSHKHTPKLRGL